MTDRRCGQVRRLESNGDGPSGRRVKRAPDSVLAGTFGRARLAE
jgi:hypothetical protein